jgi:DNA-binding transcriptional LysR family regulator
MSTTLRGINLNRLIVFVAVVEAGSLTAAAGRLGIAKTMVSAHMQRLEAELGTSLLVRTTRRLALTEAGEAFHEAARALVQSAEEAVNTIGQDSAELRGTLRITAPVDYSATIVAPLVVALQREHPKLAVELLAGDRRYDLVAEGIDVAIRAAGSLADSTHQAVRVADLANWLVAAPQLIADAPRVVRPRDLAALPFIGLTVMPTSWTFEGPGARRERIHFEPRLRANTSHATRAAALAGGGLAILPDYSVADDVAAGRLVRVLPRWALPSGGVFAIFPATRYRPRKVRVLIDALRAHLAGPAAPGRARQVAR